MGHIIFIIMHLVAIAFGFIGLFLTIPLHLVYSAATKKDAAYREDGKKREGGMFGFIIDDIETDLNMRDCPYCLKKIMKAASRCPHCQSDVDPVRITEAERKSAGWKKFFYYTGVSVAVLLVLSLFL